MRQEHSGAHAAGMFLHHDMTRELVRSHQRELQREAASRRLARVLRRRRRSA